MNNEVKNEDERFISLIVKKPLHYFRIIILIILILLLNYLIIVDIDSINQNNPYFLKFIIFFLMYFIFSGLKEVINNYTINYKKFLSFSLILTSFSQITILISFIYSVKFSMWNYANLAVSVKSNKLMIFLPILLFILIVHTSKAFLLDLLLCYRSKNKIVKIINSIKLRSVFSKVTYEFEVDGKVYRNQQIIYTILLNQPMEVDFKVLYNPCFPNFNKIL